MLANVLHLARAVHLGALVAAGTAAPPTAVTAAPPTAGTAAPPTARVARA